MKPVPLINEPNIGYAEAKFENNEYVSHKWCWRWQSPLAKKKYREPMMVRADQGPLRCELCGRRAGRILRKMIRKNCVTMPYDEFFDEVKFVLTYYHFRREDLVREDIKPWALQRRLLEELS